MTYALPVSESLEVDARHWLVAFTVAAALHAAVFLQWPDSHQNKAEAPGVGGTSISIAMTASLAGAENAVPDPIPTEDVPVEEASSRIPIVPAASPRPPESNEVPVFAPPPPETLTVAEIAPAVPIEDAVDVPTVTEQPPELIPIVEPTLAVTAAPAKGGIVQPRPPVKPVTAQNETVESMMEPAPATPTKPVRIPEKEGVSGIPTTAQTPQSANQYATAETAPPASAPAAPIGSGRAAEAPAGSAADTRSSTGGAAVLTPFPDYARTLREWLERHKDYPKLARRKRMQGSAVLYFRFGRDGKILAQEIRKSSGHGLLDEATLQMLVRAAPLPVFPKDMPGDYLDVVLPIEYSLAGKN